MDVRPLDHEVRRPASASWRPDLLRQRNVRAIEPDMERAEVWCCDGIVVVTNIENVTPGGWTWHVSVSEHGQRPGRLAMEAVRRTFGMQEAEEDNHSPGMRIRSLWLPIDPAQRRACPCKAEEEPTILDAGRAGDLDRFIWRPGLNEGGPR
jgi:hypothetical protein